MSVETAEIVLSIIAGIGCAVWIASLQFLLKSMRTRRSAFSGDETAAPPGNWSVGTTEVDGEQEALMNKAISWLVTAGAQGPNSIGPLKIMEKTQDCIVFQQAGIMTGGVLFQQGRLLFAPTGTNRTRIDYALELPANTWMLALGWAFQCGGIIALVVGFWLVYTYCATSLNPMMRMQTFQMGQTVHFLWPPFLFGGLYRQRRNLAFTSIETMLHNLPYLE